MAHKKSPFLKSFFPIQILSTKIAFVAKLPLYPTLCRAKKVQQSQLNELEKGNNKYLIPKENQFHAEMVTERENGQKSNAGSLKGLIREKLLARFTLQGKFHNHKDHVCVFDVINHFFPTTLPLEPSSDPETSGLSINTYLRAVGFGSKWNQGLHRNLVPAL